jgi:hypothetical protein
MAEDLTARARVLTSNLKEFHKIQLNYDKSISKLNKNVN